jgi:predicted Zn finger-like uncharacterized protein
LTVYCSHCSTGYLLPDHLLGPRGARVRCPKCGKTFVVLRETAGETEAAPGFADTNAVEPLAPEATPTAAISDFVSGAIYEAPAPGTGYAPDATPADVATADDALAREMLDALAAECGPRLAEARGRGRVLAEFGPELMRTFEGYRRRATDPGALLAFKRVLRDRWGVDLITGVEA